MNADPTERPMYNVTRTETGDPGATPEIVNPTPLGISAAVFHAIDLVNEHVALGFKSRGPLRRFVPPGVRQRYILIHNDGRGVIVDVCEAREEVVS